MKTKRAYSIVRLLAIEVISPNAILISSPRIPITLEESFVGRLKLTIKKLEIMTENL